MSIKKGLFGAIGLSLLAAGLQQPAHAQSNVAAEPAQAAIAAETTDELNVVSAPVSTDEAIALEATTPEAIAPEVITPTDNVLADLTFDEPPLQLADLTFDGTEPQALEQPESFLTAPELTTEAVTTADALIAVDSNFAEPMQPITEAAELGYPAIEAPEELAQVRRRRTRGGADSGANFIGIGADFGYTSDVSFAAISKFSFSERWAVRPTVLFGNEFSVLVPVTYDFSSFGADVGGFQIKPYAGAGASFSDRPNTDSDINLLLSAGLDVPISQQFTFNAQVNWGVLNDSQFGATVGVGYNLGNIFQ